MGGRIFQKILGALNTKMSSNLYQALTFEQMLRIQCYKIAAKTERVQARKSHTFYAKFRGYGVIFK